MRETIYLLFGSNEGDRLRLLTSAARYLVLHLAEGPAVCSSVYETAAWGKEDQPSFLNMAVQIETTQLPELVLAAVHQIEQNLGRQRTEQWGQRTLDVDILFYGAHVVDRPQLIIPHPHLQDRRFALTPMAEIAPQFKHPVLHKTMAELLDICPDPLPVAVFQSPVI